METIGKVTWLIVEIIVVAMAAIILAALSIALSPFVILNRAIGDEANTEEKRTRPVKN